MAVGTSEPRCYHCGHILSDINAVCPICLPNGVGKIDSGQSQTFGDIVRIRDDAMTADQQIRAKALECTIRLLASAPEGVKASATPGTTMEIASDFEHYIREGK